MSHGRKAFGITKKQAADFHHIKKKKKEEFNKTFDESGMVKHSRVAASLGGEE